MAFRASRFLLAKVYVKMDGRQVKPRGKEGGAELFQKLTAIQTPSSFPAIYDYWYNRLFRSKERGSTVPLFVRLPNVSEREFKDLYECLQKERKLIRSILSSTEQVSFIKKSEVDAVCEKIKQRQLSPLVLCYLRNLVDLPVESPTSGTTVRDVFAKAFVNADSVRQLALFLLMGCTLRESNQFLSQVWHQQTVFKVMQSRQLVDFALFGNKPQIVAELARQDTRTKTLLLWQIDQYCTRMLNYMHANPLKRHKLSYPMMETLKSANRAAMQILKAECIASGLGSANVLELADLERNVASNPSKKHLSDSEDERLTEDREDLTLVNERLTPAENQFKEPKRLSSVLSDLYQMYFSKVDYRAAGAPKICEILPGYQSFGRLGSLSYYNVELAHDMRQSLESDADNMPTEHRLLDLIRLIITLEPVHPFVAEYALLKLHEYQETGHLVSVLGDELGICEFAQAVKKGGYQKSKRLVGDPPRHLRQAMRQANVDADLELYSVEDTTEIVLVDNMELLKKFGAALNSATVVGIDAEWPSLNLELQLLRPELTVSVIQFGLLLKSGAKAAFLLDMVKILDDNTLLNVLCNYMQKFFARTDVVTVGFSIGNDIAVLTQLFPQLPKTPTKVIDFQDTANRLLLQEFTNWKPNLNSNGSKEPLRFGQGGLSKLVEHTLHKRMDKSFQVSNWHQRPLKPAQVEYAALDVLSLIDLYTFKDNRLPWKSYSK